MGYDQTASSEWVGIDGLATNDVIQAGTRQNAIQVWFHDISAPSYCDIFPGWVEHQNMSCGKWWQFESYYAWYEYFPDQEQAISGLDIAPGDQATVYVYTDRDPSNNILRGNFIVCNQTSGLCTIESELEPEGQNYSGTSVEWIIERPTIDGSYSALADYGQTVLGSAIYRHATGPYLFYFEGYMEDSFDQIGTTEDGTVNTNGLSFAVSDGDGIGFTWLGFQ